MPPKRKRAADAKGNKRMVPAKRATRSQISQLETITLSLDVNNDNSKGNVVQTPLVEKMFDIDTILNDPNSAEQSTSVQDNMSFNLRISDEMSPEKIKCSSDDLSAHVPRQLKAKIWSHKYFNIALLLKGTTELNEMFSRGVLYISPEGKVEAKPRQSKEIIPNMEHWSDAFLIFISICVVRYPSKVQEILKYLSVIRDAASKFSPICWRSYDEQFRMRQENHVTRWDHINSDLWLSSL